ncbi:Uncharacterised protein [uncultured archaeon]|nr:Uncharacterised protein [uncultured archaeon]
MAKLRRYLFYGITASILFLSTLLLIAQKLKGGALVHDADFLLYFAPVFISLILFFSFYLYRNDIFRKKKVSSINDVALSIRRKLGNHWELDEDGITDLKGTYKGRVVRILFLLDARQPVTSSIADLPDYFVRINVYMQHKKNVGHGVTQIFWQYQVFSLPKIPRSSYVETDDVTFDKKFFVRTNDRVQARDFLSPSIIQLIKQNLPKHQTTYLTLSETEIVAHTDDQLGEPDILDLLDFLTKLSV